MRIKSLRSKIKNSCFWKCVFLRDICSVHACFLWCQNRTDVCGDIPEGSGQDKGNKDQLLGENLYWLAYSYRC